MTPRQEKRNARKFFVESLGLPVDMNYGSVALAVLKASEGKILLDGVNIFDKQVAAEFLCRVFDRSQRGKLWKPTRILELPR